MQLFPYFNVMVLVREECLSYGLPPWSRVSEETSDLVNWQEHEIGFAFML